MFTLSRERRRGGGVKVFHDRADAAVQLAQVLKGRAFREPLVLAIPRGGVVTGAVLARELNSDLDVVLAHKLRAPGRPELAVGAVAEDGQVYLNDYARDVPGLTSNYLVAERRHQLAEITRRRELFRGARPPAPVAGRSVIVTDDGIATGATMIAAMRGVQAQGPHELIAAVPVAAPDRIREVGTWCDDVVCLLAADDFAAVGRFYEDFAQVDDEQVVALLRAFAPGSEARGGGQKTRKVNAPAPLLPM